MESERGRKMKDISHKPPDGHPVTDVWKRGRSE
ncbi:hypothetical protein HALLA_12790 [Halostagnicola larsenii XH-48]|uniref:Uncharacterized protein n=1 Tax=Halostagnicola larsenii XH-48 TaxID=797299 RepID=W0JUJ6_9EURY|nr:hypothetical protein HALLA_12790 [Halostagnicola larsenii XH-48]